MAHIIFGKDKYLLLGFDNEAEFEKAVVENKSFLFGPDVIYLDVKKLMGKRNNHARGIPDGYLIDFFDIKHPQLYFVENELISHDVYGHIIEQLSRFASMAISSQLEIKGELVKYIRSESDICKAIEGRLTDTPFHNLDELMNFLTEQNDIKTVLVIDEQTNDLNLALRIFRSPPDVVVLQRYSGKNGDVYFYEPMRDEVEDIEINSRNVTEFDTAVCAAFPDGFQRAYIEQSAWWAIRLSQEARERLKYLAIYEKAPIGEVKHVAEIDRVEPYKDTGKFLVYLKNKQKISAVKLDYPPKRGVAPQGPRFTSYQKLLKAKKLSDLWR